MLKVNPQTSTINFNGIQITRRDAEEIKNAFWVYDQSETMKRVKEQRMGRKITKREKDLQEWYGS